MRICLQIGFYRLIIEFRGGSFIWSLSHPDDRRDLNAKLLISLRSPSTYHWIDIILLRSSDFARILFRLGSSSRGGFFPIMLRSFADPSLAYDLVGLSNRGLVSVGRETESIIKLDSPDVSLTELWFIHCYN